MRKSCATPFRESALVLFALLARSQHCPIIGRMPQKQNPGRASDRGWCQADLLWTTLAEGVAGLRARFFFRRPRLAFGLLRGGGAKP